ncbi:MULTISPECIES: PaaI family thioesterase [unclassified Haladaptatus]|uniref:PaaI family thioesterase n=1 Tax=unclassified Haladaptatus TaxID=2622732 RepID=UPI0023E8D66E|nr:MULTISPECIES: PaaI family thioesterase [unclassified Haladaptatus]
MSEPQVPDGTASTIQHFIDERHGFLSWLGTQVEDVRYGEVDLTIPFDDKLTNPSDPPTIHGGVAATLIDTAGGLALRTTLENPIEDTLATVNLNVNYLRRASSDITAHAEVIRTGSSIGWVEVTVESETPDGERKEVATGQAAFRLFQS